MLLIRSLPRFCRASTGFASSHGFHNSDAQCAADAGFGVLEAELALFGPPGITLQPQCF